ncbi:non-ribosomal peptide synthetase, partial [Janthinobacterium sp. BJB426]
MWLIDHFNGGTSTQYHMPQVLELGGALDLKLLHAALLTVVRRHEVLRTVYASDGDTVWQEVHEVTAFELPVDEITPQTLEQAVEAECARPFALGSDLPLRGRVLRLSDERHVLVLVMHHIASDGWSSAILVRECCEAYAALAQGRTLALPALPVQYADYAYWQQQEPQQARHAQQLRYWEEKLAGLPTVHSLPLDYPRPTQQSFRGALHRSRLDAELSARLVAACRVQGATLFMGLHAVFSALLSRYSGADDIAIGTPIANREQPEVAALIGFFVNTLVLRVQIDGEGSFADLLRQCRETGLAAYAHQQLPFNELVEALNPARSLSYAALFQVMLSLQNNEQESGSLAGLSVTPMESAQRTAQFDLTLDVKDDGAGLAMSWIYCSDLFTPATIGHLADSFVCLLEAALAAPDAPMARLSLIDGVSRAALLDAGRATLVPAEAACLHQAFALRAASQPAAVALIDGERQWSYGELERAANGLAQRLQTAGAMPGTRVGLCLERSAEVVVGILAILKCGASYVPLDPIYPGERIAFMLGDAAISIVLAQASTRHLVAKGCDVLLLDDGAMPEFDGDWTPVAGHADDQAYVIYTSGSTGQPKGVMVSHANVARLFSSTAPWYRFNEQDCWCLFHSYAFDFSVWEIWGALLHGGRLVVVPRAVAQSTPDFYQLVRDQRVTVLNQTPSAFYAFIEQDQLTPAPLALRTVVFGGEALALDKLRPWFERHSDTAPELVNMYGITETTVHVSYRRIRQID